MRNEYLSYTNVFTVRDPEAFIAQLQYLTDPIKHIYREGDSFVLINDAPMPCEVMDSSGDGSVYHVDFVMDIIGPHLEMDIVAMLTEIIPYDDTVTVYESVIDFYGEHAEYNHTMTSIH